MTISRIDPTILLTHQIAGVRNFAQQVIENNDSLIIEATGPEIVSFYVSDQNSKSTLKCFLGIGIYLFQQKGSKNLWDSFYYPRQDIYQLVKHHIINGNTSRYSL